MIAIGKRYRTKSTYNWQNSHTIIIIIIIFHKNTKYFWLSFNSIVSITCCANLKSLKSSLCLDINSAFMGFMLYIRQRTTCPDQTSRILLCIKNIVY